ncbi:glucosamine-6-phosphate deaminase [Leucobacter sp. cx-42]|uniref:glucosamine-6-phosphate deaminase n=1 Tax=unclassified Leucobacter TaxID=2621730 RepID=UPI00165EA290|nr:MULTISPECIES: glucosamine-6-phosphate deaminase [unclassified Leucobacter]MBC9953441.1 glucosamine-6-phosphate deaminase [Leucobacter sp. cx-42]
MEIHVIADPQELGALAASHVVAAIERNSQAVIGLATGSTPLPLYRAWAASVAESKLDVSQVRGFALDEYAGISPEHPESYRSVITNEVVIPVGLTPEFVRVPPSSATDADAAEYDNAIKAAGGIDLQILGIGRNGHLGFNEPGTAFDSRTHRISLTPETIEDNARFFDSVEEVPTEAITQGLGTILDSRIALVIATGESKAAAVAAAITGEVTTDMPASILQRHPNVIWCLDTAAASQLPAELIGA